MTVGSSESSGASASGEPTVEEQLNNAGLGKRQLFLFVIVSMLVAGWNASPTPAPTTFPHTHLCPHEALCGGVELNSPCVGGGFHVLRRLSVVERAECGAHCREFRRSFFLARQPARNLRLRAV